MTRRALLGGVAALSLAASAGGRALAAPSASELMSGPPVDFEAIVALARARAEAAFEPSEQTLMPPFEGLDRASLRAIRPDPEAPPLLPRESKFRLDPLPPGHVFRTPVRIAVVHPDRTEPVPFDAGRLHFEPSHFTFPGGRAPEGTGEGLDWSGFRMRHPINGPDRFDPFVVFQGASHFRAIARGLIYGLAARGLAIGTGDPRGEEFPVFTHFWVRAPEPGSGSIRLHALLDGASCAAAFDFEIRPGDTTVMEIVAAIFPRRDIAEAGIAPLTSMYFFGPERRVAVDDFRDAVHDSSGLQMITGGGRRLWRPLKNPGELQTSSFADTDPLGYGLVQRDRRFEAYQDAVAQYERKPSAWVEPVGDWGEGAVVLIEIPVTNEYNDNIVAFWRPKQPLRAGEERRFAYRLHWTVEPPDGIEIARVAATRQGRSPADPAARRMVVDFRNGTLPPGELTPEITASAGEIRDVTLRPIPGTDLVRVTFEYLPGDAAIAELFLELKGPEGPASETWLYRWTAA